MDGHIGFGYGGGMKQTTAKSDRNFAGLKRRSVAMYLDDCKAGFDSVRAWNTHKARMAEFEKRRASKAEGRPL